MAERSTPVGPVPFVNDPDFVLHLGDVRDVLATLPDESVHCCLTSPPFYGLRDYGMEEQIGLEESPDEWAALLVEVFAEVRRVLRPDGSLWIECGDSYSSGNREGHGTRIGAKQGTNRASAAGHDWYRPPMAPGIKPKDLLGQPFLLAFALRTAGWYWRGCYPWAKPNAMPESAKDRCTTAHSYLLHFAKSQRYFFDGAAISEPAAWDRWGDQTTPKYEGTDTASGWIKPKSKEELDQIKTKKPDGWATHEGGHGSFHRDREKGEVAYVNPGNRTTNGQKGRTDERRGFDNRLERADGLKHPRSVWTIPTQGYPDAHFATWPEALAARIIKAATSEHGCCVTCGAPFVREVEPVGDYADALNEPTWASGGLSHGRGGPESARKSRTTTTTTTTTGWRATCDCHGSLVEVTELVPIAGTEDTMTETRIVYTPDENAPPPVACVVLDPFMGSGTTALVARKLARRAIGVELNPEYARLCATRLAQQSLFAEIA